MGEKRAELEAPVRSACEAGDFDQATTLAIELYGTDIYAYLSAMLRSDSDAAEAFSDFLERLWLGLAAFEWRSGLRGWCYTIARNAALSLARTRKRRREDLLTAAQHSHLSMLLQRVRSASVLAEKTENRNRIRELRESLPEEEQTLLFLRVDRGLSFRELAIAMSDDGVELEGDALTREAARLRKRFERARDDLRALAEQEGLLAPRDG